jgi:hypothetical protein
MADYSKSVLYVSVFAFLSIFSSGCWNTIDRGLELYFSKPKVEEKKSIFDFGPLDPLIIPQAPVENQKLNRRQQPDLVYK